MVPIHALKPIKAIYPFILQFYGITSPTLSLFLFNCSNLTCFSGSVPWAQYLLECGNPVDAMTDDGKTPLKIAMDNKDNDMERFLRTQWGAKEIDVFSIAEDQIRREEEMGLDKE